VTGIAPLSSQSADNADRLTSDTVGCLRTGEPGVRRQTRKGSTNAVSITCIRTLVGAPGGSAGQLPGAAARKYPLKVIWSMGVRTRTMMNSKYLLTGGIAVVLTLALCGCEGVSHVSAELEHGSVRFAYCAAYSPTEIEVWQSRTSDWSRAKVVWRAEGTPPLRPGEAITYAVPPAGFATTEGPTKFAPARSQLEVDFIDPKKAKTLPYSTGDFDGTKLVEGRWLNWNGQIVDKPCVG
jgi:hypothetical protein